MCAPIKTLYLLLCVGIILYMYEGGVLLYASFYLCYVIVNYLLIDVENNSKNVEVYL